MIQEEEFPVHLITGDEIFLVREEYRAGYYVPRSMTSESDGTLIQLLIDYPEKFKGDVFPLMMVCTKMGCRKKS